MRVLLLSFGLLPAAAVAQSNEATEVPSITAPFVALADMTAIQEQFGAVIKSDTENLEFENIDEFANFLLDEFGVALVKTAENLPKGYTYSFYPSDDPDGSIRDALDEQILSRLSVGDGYVTIAQVAYCFDPVVCDTPQSDFGQTIAVLPRLTPDGAFSAQSEDFETCDGICVSGDIDTRFRGAALRWTAETDIERRGDKSSWVSVAAAVQRTGESFFRIRTEYDDGRRADQAVGYTEWGFTPFVDQLCGFHYGTGRRGSVGPVTTTKGRGTADLRTCPSPPTDMTSRP